MKRFNLKTLFVVLTAFAVGLGVGLLCRNELYEHRVKGMQAFMKAQLDNRISSSATILVQKAQIERLRFATQLAAERLERLEAEKAEEANEKRYQDVIRSGGWTTRHPLAPSQ